MSDQHQVTDLQIALLRVLWQRRSATVAEVTTALEPDRALAPTTVATLLRRLERRGLVTHDVHHRQFVYRATVAESDVRRSMVGELTDLLFGGNPAALVSHLLSEREIAPGDLAKVKNLIAEYEARSSNGGDNGR